MQKLSSKSGRISTFSLDTWWCVWTTSFTQPPHKSFDRMKSSKGLNMEWLKWVLNLQNKSSCGTFNVLHLKSLQFSCKQEVRSINQAATFFPDICFVSDDQSTSPIRCWHKKSFVIMCTRLVLKPAVTILLLCEEDGDALVVVILYITQRCWRVSFLCACASFPVLWKVLLSVGPRLTPTEAVNYQRWQHSFHLATITHIPQPPSKGLQSPTQVQGSCSVGTSWGGGVGWGGSGCRDGQASLSFAFIHKRSTVRTSSSFMFPANDMHDGAKIVDLHQSTSLDKRGTTAATVASSGEFEPAQASKNCS